MITQLAAAQAALHRVGTRLMGAGIRHCVTDPEQAEDEGMSAQDMEELFLILR